MLRDLSRRLPEFQTTAARSLIAALPAAAADLSAPRMGAWGFDMSGRDPATPAAGDFFLHANGAYLDRVEIPADRSSFGAFDALRELSVNRIHAVLDAAAADPAPSADRRRLATLYRNYMDEAAVAALGAKPIAPALKEIRGLHTHREAARLMGRAAGGFGGSVFSVFISDDARNPQLAGRRGAGGAPDAARILAQPPSEPSRGQLAPPRASRRASARSAASTPSAPRKQGRPDASQPVQVERNRSSTPRAPRRASQTRTRGEAFRGRGKIAAAGTHEGLLAQSVGPGAQGFRREGLDEGGEPVCTLAIAPDQVLEGFRVSKVEAAAARHEQPVSGAWHALMHPNPGATQGEDLRDHEACRPCAGDQDILPRYGRRDDKLTTSSRFGAGIKNNPPCGGLSGPEALDPKRAFPPRNAGDWWFNGRHVSRE